MRLLIVFFAVLSVLFSGCSSAVETSSLTSAFDVAQAVLKDRMVDYSETSGNIVIKFDARDNVSPDQIKKGILDDARSVLKALYTNPNLKLQKVTLEALFELKDTKTGQVEKGVVGRIVFDPSAPVDWSQAATLDSFEKLLTVSDFPYNQ